MLNAEIQGYFQKQRCLPCWVSREVFDHVRSRNLDPLNNYACTEQKTANYINVDFQTPCVPWQRWYWDTYMAMCTMTEQWHICTIQRYMAISLYWDKGNGHLHHLWHMCSIQRYKDIFENRNLYQTLECPRRRSTKLQNITHVLVTFSNLLEKSWSYLSLPLSLSSSSLCKNAHNLSRFLEAKISQNRKLLPRILQLLRGLGFK